MLQRWKVLELIITITRRLLEASAVAQTCSCMLMQHAYFYINSCLVTFPPARDCLRQTNCFASGMVQNFWQISTFSFLRIGSRENQSGIRTVMLGSIYGKACGKRKRCIVSPTHAGVTPLPQARRMLARLSSSARCSSDSLAIWHCSPASLW